MFNKRLLKLVDKTKSLTIQNVLVQWIGLLSNIILMAIIAYYLSSFIINQTIDINIEVIVVVMVCILIKYLSITFSTRLSFILAKNVKQTLRMTILNKLFKLDDQESINTADIIQVSIEGVEQLETYFGLYLPQLFYSILAPLTLFVVIFPLNKAIAGVLLLGVFLIPISIVVVMKIAKKILAKYWSKYTALGDSFLENLQGMTTLKIYEADEFKRKQMQEEAESFRKVTMKVLSMQLNSITIMDLVTYGGYAVGGIMAINALGNNSLSFAGCMFILLVASDFFIPMRRLGSYFHIAMNGIAASDKIFNLLDSNEKTDKDAIFTKTIESIHIDNVSFNYDETEILKDINLDFRKGELTAIVGESGCGKSTITKLLMNRLKASKGEILFDNLSVEDINEIELLKSVNLLTHNSYLFKGSVKENLLMANSEATDSQLLEAIERVNMTKPLKDLQGLDTLVLEQGSNFSMGQRQRLAFARALLKESDVYIFDEVSANVDQESEALLMNEIYNIAKTKVVIVVAHRLKTIETADNIYVLSQGKVVESGKHKELLENKKTYSKLYYHQQKQSEVEVKNEK